jgi:CheY-like chemotaxis protein
VPETRNTGQARIVLLIDDDAAVLDSTGSLLEAFGHTVHAAADGSEALRQITLGVVPDVVITDFRLPGANGLNVVEEIRRQVGREIPAIIVTGDTTNLAVREADLPSCWVLHKPADAARIRSLIESC